VTRPRKERKPAPSVKVVTIEGVYGSWGGRGARGDSTPDPGRESALGRRVQRTKRAARLSSAATSAPVAAAAVVRTATDAESCQWRKRTVTASGFWKAKMATARRRTATTARRACID
jgi:hypothetical protein